MAVSDHIQQGRFGHLKGWFVFYWRSMDKFQNIRGKPPSKPVWHAMYWWDWIVRVQTLGHRRNSMTVNIFKKMIFLSSCLKEFNTTTPISWHCGDKNDRGSNTRPTFLIIFNISELIIIIEEDHSSTSISIASYRRPTAAKSGRHPSTEALSPVPSP